MSSYITKRPSRQLMGDGLLVVLPQENAFTGGPTGLEHACDIYAKAARCNGSSGFLSLLGEHTTGQRIPFTRMINLDSGFLGQANELLWLKVLGRVVEKPSHESSLTIQ